MTKQNDVGGVVYPLECKMFVSGKWRTYWLVCDMATYETEKDAGGPCRALLASPAAGGGCEHRFMYFGDQKFRRCADCCEVERPSPPAIASQEVGNDSAE